MSGVITNHYRKILNALMGVCLEQTDNTANSFTTIGGNKRYLTSTYEDKFGVAPAGGSNNLSLRPVNSNIVTSTSSSSAGLIFGNGSTEADADAYCVSNPITSGISVESFNNRNGVAHIVVYNSTSSDITIGEFGIVCNVNGFQTTSYDVIETFAFLAYHHVFDAAVTLKASHANNLSLAIKLTNTGNTLELV